MTVGGETFAGAETVDPDRQRPLRRDRRVLLAERARGSVSRVRCGLLSLGDEPFVQGVEAAQREIDLAPDLQQRRRRLVGRELHPHRDCLDRLQVRRHVLAANAVATRCAADEDAVLVDQVDRQPVDLRLGDVGDIARAEPLADVLVPLLDRLVGGHLLE